MQRFRSEQSGQSLVLVAIMMFVICGVAALAIDASSWMQRRHQTQVVADSAALAAANCLANPGTTSGSIVLAGVKTTLPACSSATDTADATTVAEDFAQANGVTLTSSQISFNTTTDRVSVNASATSPGFFASLFGLRSTTQSAAAQAKWTQGSSNSPCTAVAQDEGQCYALYATDPACPGETQTQGLVLNAGSQQIDGAAHSDGELFLDPPGQYDGPITYGTGSGCGAYTYSGLNNGSSGWTSNQTSFGDGAPSAASGSAGVPMPYGTSAYPFPSCTSSSSITSSVVIAPTSNTVYCYTNTSSSAATVTLSSSGSGDTFICKSTGTGACNIATQGGGMTFTAYNYSSGQHLLMYATGAIDLGGGSTSFTGDIDAPNGTITMMSGSNTNTGMLEGYDVIYGGGSNMIIGDGVVPSGSSTGASGSDQLTQ